MTNKEKIEGLKKFLDNNNVSYTENYKSGFNVTIDLKITKFMIAVHVENNGDCDDFYRAIKNPYTPFMIRDSDTLDFVIEKMQNCIVQVLLRRQRAQNNRERKEKNIQMHKKMVELAKERRRKRQMEKEAKEANRMLSKEITERLKEESKIVQSADEHTKRKRKRIVRYEKV